MKAGEGGEVLEKGANMREKGRYADIIQLNTLDVTEHQSPMDVRGIGDRQQCPESWITITQILDEWNVT